jgi:hypothetical protein
MSFIFSWNQFLFSLILSGPKTKTVPGNATTAAKVGFYLEQHRESLMVDEAHLKTFRDRRPRQPHYLERSRRKAGRFVAAWNLVVPEEVYGRSWEEEFGVR